MKSALTSADDAWVPDFIRSEDHVRADAFDLLENVVLGW